jgi:hypothetical protein
MLNSAPSMEYKALQPPVLLDRQKLMLLGVFTITGPLYARMVEFKFDFWPSNFICNSYPEPGRITAEILVLLVQEVDAADVKPTTSAADESARPKFTPEKLDIVCTEVENLLGSPSARFKYGCTACPSTARKRTVSTLHKKDTDPFTAMPTVTNV